MNSPYSIRVDARISIRFKSFEGPWFDIEPELTKSSVWENYFPEDVQFELISARETYKNTWNIELKIHKLFNDPDTMTENSIFFHNFPPRNQHEMDRAFESLRDSIEFFFLPESENLFTPSHVLHVPNPHNPDAYAKIIVEFILIHDDRIPYEYHWNDGQLNRSHWRKVVSPELIQYMRQANNANRNATRRQQYQNVAKVIVKADKGKLAGKSQAQRISSFLTAPRRGGKTMKNQTKLNKITNKKITRHSK
jgi:hypothetical protein